jgi:hypothetical protein
MLIIPFLLYPRLNYLDLLLFDYFTYNIGLYFLFMLLDEIEVLILLFLIFFSILKFLIVANYYPGLHILIYYQICF